VVNLASADRATPAVTEHRTTFDDGTVAVTWRDGDVSRARVEHAGAQFVRHHTREDVLARIPKRHVHRRAQADTDLLVFQQCIKDAKFIWLFEDWLSRGCP
jgi:hypothetical protein